LTSKPTWSNAFGCFRHVGFFCSLSPAVIRKNDSFAERCRAMLATRRQPFGVVWPQMNQVEEEMEQWLRRVENERKTTAGLGQSVYRRSTLFEDGQQPVTLKAELPDLEWPTWKSSSTATISCPSKASASNPISKRACGNPPGARPRQFLPNGRIAAVRGQRQGHGRIPTRCVDHSRCPSGRKSKLDGSRSKPANFDTSFQ